MRTRHTPETKYRRKKALLPQRELPPREVKEWDRTQPDDPEPTIDGKADERREAVATPGYPEV